MSVIATRQRGSGVGKNGSVGNRGVSGVMDLFCQCSHFKLLVPFVAPSSERGGSKSLERCKEPCEYTLDYDFFKGTVWNSFSICQRTVSCITTVCIR